MCTKVIYAFAEVILYRSVLRPMKRRSFPMLEKSGKINTEIRKAQIELQNREISETLGHIKNKILVDEIVKLSLV